MDFTTKPGIPYFLYIEGNPEKKKLGSLNSPWNITGEIIGDHWVSDLVTANSDCYDGLNFGTILDGQPTYSDGVHPTHAGCVALAAALMPIVGY